MKPCQLTTLADIEESLRKEITAFIKLVSPSFPSACIVERFSIYDHVISSRKDGELSAVQFVNIFSSGKDQYTYLGSLFSRNAAFLQLFMSWLSGECRKFPASNIYLMAEFQNPELFLLYKSIFLHCSYPGIDEELVPGAVMEKCRIFSQHVSHIQGLNTLNLSTHSSSSVFTYKPKYAALMDWLGKRSIFPGRGDNQAMLVSLETGARPELLNMLDREEYSMSHWFSRMKSLLSQIQENA
jgi:hypothetical protein